MFSNLRTSTKLLTLCATFILSVGVPVYALVVEKRIAIEFTRKEIAGSQYLAAIREIYTSTLAALMQAEQPAASTDALLRPLLNPATAITLSSSELAHALSVAFRDVWRQRTQEDTNVDAPVVVVLSRARALALRTGDDFNLALDPDLDTFYLQSIVVDKVPLLLQRLCEVHKVWNSPTPTSDEGLSIFQGLLRAVAGELQDSLAAAYRGSADEALQLAAQGKFVTMLTSMDHYLGTLKDVRTGAHSTSGPTDLLRKTVQDALAAWDVAHVELDRLLQRRVDTLRGRMHSSLSVIGAFVAFSLLIATLTHRAIVRPLERLEAVASAVRVSKDYSLRAKHDSRDEIGRVTAAINDMLSELAVARARETAEQSQFARVTRLTTMGEMAASIAHEVNQPLAAIVANSNAGLRWLTRTPPELDRLEKVLHSIARDGHRASQVISSVRSMVKKDAQEMVLVDVARFIQDVLELLWVELQSEKISVQVHCTPDMPPIRANHVQLQQVLSNLVTNAIDAMHDVVDRPRTLRIQAEHHRPDSTVIAVEDSGPGIDAKNKDRIFRGFFQHQRQRTRSWPLDLPLDCRKPWWPAVGFAKRSTWHDFPHPTAHEPVVTEDSKPVVYVLDDDASLREALANLFASVGLHAETFASPAEFLDKKISGAASCLVLDVRLPGRSGLDLQAELAKANIQIPIIFVTGHGDIPMTVRAMKAGAVEFLTKPLHDQQLLDAVQRALDLDRVWRAERKSASELRTRFDTLTDREQEVIKFVIAGQLNKQIAHTLGVSEITVKVHRANAMRKIGAKSLADLMKMSHVLQLGDPSG